jgi:serine/threonine-protein phosphatase 4 catalytic subunit
MMARCVTYCGLILKVLYCYIILDIDEWENNPRGAGVIFGAKLVDRFLRQNGIDLIVRAHQLIMEGYKEHFDKKLITIWSAPNYCYRYMGG